MMSSAALPNVAFSRPPSVGPVWKASAVVASPMSAASGRIESAAVTKSHGEAGRHSATAQDAGSSTRSRFSRLLVTAPRTPTGRVLCAVALFCLVVVTRR